MKKFSKTFRPKTLLM